MGAGDALGDAPFRVIEASNYLVSLVIIVLGMAGDALGVLLSYIKRNRFI
jgi:hypothetical protein